MSVERMRSCAPPLVLVLVLAIVIGACGSASHGGAAVDPATVTPASSPFYLGAEVQPAEPLRSSARLAGRALTHEGDPFLRLLDVLRTPGSPKLDFARDLRPWLGARAGLFLASTAVSGAKTAPGAGIGALLTQLQRALAGEPGAAGASAQFPFSSAGVDGAILLDTSDAAKARAFLTAQAARAGARATSYRGVRYEASAAGVALGIVGQLAVIGSEAGLRAVVDTSLGAPALARAPGYAKLVAQTPAGALAHLYLAPAPVAHIASGSGSSAGAQSAASEARASALLSLTDLRSVDGGRALNVSLVPSANSITLDLDALAPSSPVADGGLLAAAAAGSAALDELPAESWLGVGLGGDRASLGADVRALRSVLSLLSPGAGSGSGALSVKGLLDGFLAPLDILGAETPAARRDYQEWMTSAALFASGSSLFAVKGGVEIVSAAPARSREAVGKLAAQLRRSGTEVTKASISGTDAAVAAHVETLPLPLDIANGRDVHGKTKFVIGLGEASVTAALENTATLAGGPAQTAASAALGEGVQPSVIVDFPTLVGLLEAAGLLEDPAIAPLAGYLRALTTLSAGGAHPASGVERLRVTAGLRAPGESE